MLQCLINAAVAVWRSSSEVTALLLSWDEESLGCFFFVCVLSYSYSCS